MNYQAQNIKKSIGKVDPQELGRMFKEYFTNKEPVKETMPVPMELVKVLEGQKNLVTEALSVFDGALPLDYLQEVKTGV